MDDHDNHTAGHCCRCCVSLSKPLAWHATCVPPVKLYLSGCSSGRYMPSRTTWVSFDETSCCNKHLVCRTLEVRCMVAISSLSWLVTCREECGVDVILFNSCQPPVSSTCSRTGTKLAASVANLHTAKGSSRNWQRSSNAWLVGSAVAAGAVALLQGLTAGAMIVHTLIGLLVLVAVVWFVYSTSLGNHGHGGVSNSRSCSRSSSTLNYAQRTWHDWLSCVAAGGALWYRPVLATVQGGYTISPREDCGGVNSPECLVTCILKVRIFPYKLLDASASDTLPLGIGQSGCPGTSPCKWSSW